MSDTIIMPQLGETVAEGKILTWFKSVGEDVKLGDKLFEVETDKVTIEVLEGSRPVLEVPVAGLVGEYFGVNAYMELSALNRLLGEGNAISGAFLSADREDRGTVYDALKGMPRVAGISLRAHQAAQPWAWPCGRLPPSWW